MGWFFEMYMGVLNYELVNNDGPWQVVGLLVFMGLIGLVTVWFGAAKVVTKSCVSVLLVLVTALSSWGFVSYAVTPTEELAQEWPELSAVAYNSWRVYDAIADTPQGKALRVSDDYVVLHEHGYRLFKLSGSVPPREDVVDDRVYQLNDEELVRKDNRRLVVYEFSTVPHWSPLDLFPR